ncbi:MAG: PHP domain-containing protein [Clostridium sp.]|uniref:PHP domain-containing protein n=1 Tax=Clostridium sp. TaxID=1506 RepID=UPI003F3B6F5F
MKIDMHVHSNISDGKDSIIEILNKAKELEIQKIALTNHDTIEGLDQAINLGEEVGVSVIKGVEISAYDFRRKRKVHILGYKFNEGKNIEKLCKPILEKRNENSLWQLERLIELGYKVDKEKILKDRKVLYKQHILEELIRQGYTSEIYGSVYRNVFKNGGPLDRDIEYVDALDAVKAIKEDGGIAVLAHPAELDSFRIIGELVSVGLDGIEINHPSQKNWDKERVRIFRDEYGLILTGGSDYHGAFGKSRLGSCLCPENYIEIF